MGMENYRWLSGLIAAHPEQKIYGRTRLQKEVKLLQSLGFPTDYAYTIHFYGPYSEALHFDLGLLKNLGLISEEEKLSQSGAPYFVISATSDSEGAAIVRKYQDQIDKMVDADSVVLELAATYDAFRNACADHDEALRRLRRKKGSKCDDGNEESALKLLLDLGLQSD